ncbi:MAG TPA: carboxylate-amine ligase [Candidatus Saccharimonadia bacterium]|nr:carboxylate-amine ligase [Candidatus Saccharimonadia bacterium]
MATALHDYTFGIEEEFFLTNPRTRGLVGRVPSALLRSCKRRFGERVEHEMMQSQVETSTPICRDPAEAREWLAKLRRGIGEACDEHELTFLAAGTHPLGEWREQRHTATERYERLIDDFQIVGRRNLLCGLHIHVEAPPGSDRVDVMNRLMHWLPVFLALSASSPFWHRQRTGLVSYRQAAYDEWPRTGIPDFFDDEAGYGAFVDTLVAAGSIRDASMLWWAIRPALKFPTLELRIADSCTRVDDALAIAMLYRCLVRATVRNPSLGRARTSHTRRLIDENRWRAKRYGYGGGWIDVHSGRELGFGEALDELLGLVADDAHELGCAQYLDDARAIVARGSSAEVQLSIYRDRRDSGGLRVTALRAVVDWLIAATRAGGDGATAPTIG